MCVDEAGLEHMIWAFDEYAGFISLLCLECRQNIGDFAIIDGDGMVTQYTTSRLARGKYNVRIADP
jgi:hypothetical protein